MSPDNHGTEGDGCELHRFERNRYFHGKLMTARDMWVEQAYHTNRLNTLTRTTTGEGVVCGLAATGLTAGADTLTLDLERGLALDCCGRPIVVPNDTEVTVELRPTDQIDELDRVHLYLTWDDCLAETVPILGSEDACEEECEYNRIVEQFDVVYRTEDPERLKSVPEIEFPRAEELGDPPYTTADLVEIGRSFYEADPPECPDCDEYVGVYLGAFDEQDGEWTPVDAEMEKRPLVYPNDLVYATAVRHATRFDNPHEDELVVGRPGANQQGAVMRIAGPEALGGRVELTSGSIDIETDETNQTVALEISGLDELDDLRERVETLEDEMNTVRRYVKDKALKEKLECFPRVSETFGGDDVEVVVERILDETNEAIDEKLYRDDRAAEYGRYIRRVFRFESQLADAVRRRADADSLTRYEEALEEMAAVIADDGDQLAVAVAQDQVCEYAARLERAIIIERGADIPLRVLGGLDDDLVGVLVNAGIDSRRDLLDVDSAALADRMGVSEAEIRRAIRTVESPVITDPDAVDIRAVSGIGEEFSSRLENEGIRTLADLIGADAAALSERTNISETRVADWMRVADFVEPN